MPYSLRSKITGLVYKGILSKEEGARIREALEKQIPKKPSHYKYSCFKGYPKCPNCGTSGCVSNLIEITNSSELNCVYGGIKNNYCTQCGQAILWDVNND